MSTTIMPCKCSSRFQDTQYGPGQHAHNEAKGAATGGKMRWRCTVCGTEHDGKQVATTGKEEAR